MLYVRRRNWKRATWIRSLRKLAGRSRTRFRPPGLIGQGESLVTRRAIRMLRVTSDFPRRLVTSQDREPLVSYHPAARVMFREPRVSIFWRFASVLVKVASRLRGDQRHFRIRKKTTNKPHHPTPRGQLLSMISRNYNLNPVSIVSPHP